MFIGSIITNSSSIIKFLKKSKLGLYFTKPQMHIIALIMSAMIKKGFSGKVTDAADLMPFRHRTNIGRFLSQSPWHEDFVERALRKLVVQKIWGISKATNKPIYVAIDDTISERTVPSSKALHPIEKCSFHQSHLKGKTVYGHQLVTVMLVCDDVVMPYSISIYDKKIKSKIEMAVELIKSLPSPVNEGFVLCDSWYSCKKVFSATKDAGFKYIGGFRTNRVIYPDKYKKLGIKINHLGKTLTNEDVDLVKVGNSEYYVYSYKGRLNDLKEALIVLSWPKEALFKEGCLRAFVSTTDLTMSVLDLLNHYRHRWPIETFFRESKKKLGLDDYQVRSEKSIKRYFLIMMITYAYCGLEVSTDTLKFSEGLKTARVQLESEKISFIYERTQAGSSLDDILQLFKAA
ncbi:IS701 family transposase [Clostridium oryzae]|uniref:Transposase DDE domain protein n=1 Tax=Clostridium oryzae TaxID=1450648 RepID=A0A1V4I3T8_9CLOT|nr:IS701 family transposase [Clostridium oryzae]OPJ54530.1 transposase DDE domain protein [Clostridium oryzae]